VASDVLGIAVEAAKIAINPTSYLLEKIVKSASKNVESPKPDGPDDIVALRLETERQELEMRMAESQARVAQEVAIARRIQTAEEVEVEEYYDYHGDGHIGGKYDGANISIGAGGSGRRVSKRIFKFKGNVAFDIVSDEIPPETTNKTGSSSSA